MSPRSSPATSSISKKYDYTANTDGKDMGTRERRGHAAHDFRTLRRRTSDSLPPPLQLGDRLKRMN